MTKKPSNIVYLSNLSYKRDRNGIRSLLSSFGSIKDITIIVEPETKQSRGMAFIEMGSVAEAKLAIEGLNGKVIDRRTVKANFGVPLKAPVKTEKRPKDLDFKAKQIAKRERNEKKRKSNPLQFKAPKKKA
jgi:RNA recognition motif-containing protein